MNTCTARELLRLPNAAGSWWFVRQPGGGTTFALPDGLSTAVVTCVWDESWRMTGSDVVAVSVLLYGPATELITEDVMRLAGARWAEHGSRTSRTRQVTVALAGTMPLTLVRAMPHSCGAEPGRPCEKRWHQRVCEAPTLDPVELTPSTNAGR